MKNKIGKLFIIATPIGNLADITLRALETLKSVDLILCEDNRVTIKLLQYYGINKKLFTYNDHSKDKDRKKIIEYLKNGLNIALVSDAGTPIISDPGYKLIQILKTLEINIETIPGPCSIIAALTISGLPSDRFTFLGFLPHKISAKETILLEFRSTKSTLIFFESANRLIETLELINKFFPSRDISIAREITKLYEEVINGKAIEIIKYYNDNPDKLRGEIVLLISSQAHEEIDLEDDITNNLSLLMKTMTLKDAVETLSSQNILPKKQIYKMALKIKTDK